MGKPGEPARTGQRPTGKSVMVGSNRVPYQTAANHRKGGLAREFADFFRALKAIADPYRPELHYMRGPGPKWNAKHNPPQATIGSPTGFASANG
jgi:hypothetical protein